MALSRSNCAARTASVVNLGCVERDSKKFLSWMLGRNGSTGHDEAVSASCFATLDAAITTPRTRFDQSAMDLRKVANTYQSFYSLWSQPVRCQQKTVGSDLQSYVIMLCKASREELQSALYLAVGGRSHQHRHIPSILNGDPTCQLQVVSSDTYTRNFFEPTLRS